MTTHQILAENYLSTTLTNDIVSTTWDITVTLATPPINSKWFITISPWDLANREICYYDSVSWNNLHVYWINRIWGKIHTHWVTVQMMDVAEWINYFSQISSTVFFPEKTWDLQVTIWGWSVLIWGTQQELPDTILNLENNTTNKIYFDYTDSLVKTTTWSTWTNLVVYEVETAWWAITKVIPKKPLSLTGLSWPTWATWPKWDKWDTWAIATAPTWTSQIVNDNVVPEWTSVVTTDDTTYIKVTRADWSYTEYNLTWIREYDAEDNLLTAQLITWVFWTQTLVYASINWIVDKTTWVFTFNWELAYRNIPNIFTASNVFNSDVTFKSRTSFPFYNIWSEAWNFIFDALNWHEQKVTLTWTSSHICTFDNLVQWMNILYVVQSWSGTLIFDIWDWNWNVVTTNIINNFVTWWVTPTNPHTITSGTHIYSVLVAETWAHISYIWTSI